MARRDHFTKKCIARAGAQDKDDVDGGQIIYTTTTPCPPPSRWTEERGGIDVVVVHILWAPRSLAATHPRIGVEGGAQISGAEGCEGWPCWSKARAQPLQRDSPRVA
eukprot:6680925-Pyramimonas_sp.AAC.1